jgi:rubrerythrin
VKLSDQTILFCEKCETRMRMQSGYLMGGDHDWLRFVCPTCAQPKIVFASYPRRSVAL